MKPTKSPSHHGMITRSNIKKSRLPSLQTIPSELRLMILKAACRISPPQEPSQWDEFAPVRFLASYFSRLGYALTTLKTLVQLAAGRDEGSQAVVAATNTVLEDQLNQIEQDCFKIVAEYDKGYQHRWAMTEDDGFEGGTEEIEATDSIVKLFKEELQRYYRHVHEKLDPTSRADDSSKRWNISRLNVMFAIHRSNKVARPSVRARDDPHSLCHYLFFLWPKTSLVYSIFNDHPNCSSQ